MFSFIFPANYCKGNSKFLTQRVTVAPWINWHIDTKAFVLSPLKLACEKICWYLFALLPVLDLFSSYPSSGHQSRPLSKRVGPKWHFFEIIDQNEAIWKKFSVKISENSCLSKYLLWNRKGNKTSVDLGPFTALSEKLRQKFGHGFVLSLTFFLGSRIFSPDWPGCSAKSWQHWQVHKTVPFAAVPTSYHSSWFIDERIVIYMVK